MIYRTNSAFSVLRLLLCSNDVYCSLNNILLKKAVCIGTIVRNLEAPNSSYTGFDSPPPPQKRICQCIFVHEKKKYE